MHGRFLSSKRLKPVRGMGGKSITGNTLISRVIKPAYPIFDFILLL